MTAEKIDIDQELRVLEDRISALADYCERLRDENRQLRQRLTDFSLQHAQSADKAAIAKNRVEAMISRLKSMGHET